ncbi:MAG: hypothetical protein U9R74_00670 [Pseudomonadota bacterium]|nr:hypothetical protein [Pseudomonadota bacterium]
MSLSYFPTLALVSIISGLSFGFCVGTTDVLADVPSLGNAPATQRVGNSPASEQSVEIPAPDAGAQGADIKDPGPDFGYIPNSIGIVPPGRFYVESSVEFDHKDSDRSARVPLLLRVGAAQNWEFRLEAWAVQYEGDSSGDETGSGPIQLGFKHRLSRGGEGAFDPAYGFELEFLVPVSSGGFDDGKVEPSGFINVDHTLSPSSIFTWNVGFFTPVDETDDQFLQGFLAGAYSRFVTPSVQLYATGSLNYPASGSEGGAVSVLGIGGYWYRSRRTVLFAGYNAGLTSESPEGSGVVGASFAF